MPKLLRLMRLMLCLVAVAEAGVMAAPAAAARQEAPAVSINIDISKQSMVVTVNGWPYGWWKVSTARQGYHTPRGSWRPFALKKVYYSRKYDNAPMPNSIFFLGGYAIHGTDQIRSLGRPVSHGCIRLHPQNAARLFGLVRRYGLRATRITVSN
jgi:lipoprotein-anchoring transpeptidase ErfK/SrfK